MKIKRGSTSVRRLIFIADTSKTDGSGLANLVYNTSGLVAYYFAGDLANEVPISLATMTLGTWQSGGFVAVDNTNMPGWYEIGIPNEALDGGNEVAIQLRGASNMAPVNIYIELDAVDYQTAAFGAALATHWTSTRAGYLDGVLLAANFNQRTVSVTGGPTPHIAASIHNAEANSIPAGALTAAAIAEIQSGLALQSTLLIVAGYIDTEVSAIKAVTDKLNTGLVADGGVFQFTANMLELAPSGGGGGSATLENQELILDEIDSLRSAFATAVGRLAVASQIVGFPTVLVRNSDYSTITESEIRLSLNDLDGDPIAEIGGVACASIDWLFGLGSERAPQLIEGAATWDAATNQLVIQIDAEDTSTTPLGSLSWQIGCTIGTTTRFLGGGTTRLIERQF